MPSLDEVYPRRSVRGTLPRLYVCNMYVGVAAWPSAAFVRSYSLSFSMLQDSLWVLVGKIDQFYSFCSIPYFRTPNVDLDFDAIVMLDPRVTDHIVMDQSSVNSRKF